MAWGERVLKYFQGESHEENEMVVCFFVFAGLLRDCVSTGCQTDGNSHGKHRAGSLGWQRGRRVCSGGGRHAGGQIFFCSRERRVQGSANFRSASKTRGRGELHTWRGDSGRKTAGGCGRGERAGSADVQGGHYEVFEGLIR